MQVTDARVILVDSESASLGVKAYASAIVNDELVIRDLKVVSRPKGLFVAFPSTKARVRCADCRFKNPFSNNYCGDCGARLNPSESVGALPPTPSGKPQLYHDVVHPLHTSARVAFQDQLLGWYYRAVDGGLGPARGDLDDYDDDDDA